MQSFPDYFNRHVASIKIVPKRSSNFMVALGRLLDIAKRFGIADITKDEFLTEYTTTIGDTIYSDELTMNSAPTPLLFHEMCHRLQFLNARMPYEYIVFRESRAYYESEAIQAAMYCTPDSMGYRPRREYARRKAEHLTKYGIPESMAVLAVWDRILEIERQKVPVRPMLMKKALTEWRLTG